MASAEITKVIRKKMVEVEVQENAYSLTLSEAEARTLALLLSNIGGFAEETARKYTDAILLALQKSGVDGFGEYPSTPKYFSAKDNCVNFTPESLKFVES